jgi:hypothetical protein
MARRRGVRFWVGVGLTGVLAVAIGALLLYRDDILEALLDPQIPYEVYRPPPPPDYAKPGDWLMRPGPADAASPPVDIFFVHPTTFDGGKNWNGAIEDRATAARYYRVMAPNYAAPFASVGRMFIPRYRQASLYTSLSVFDDAIEAREFAYGDVAAAFAFFREHLSQGRPFILVGVEQGGGLAARLLRDVIAPDPQLRARLVGAYLQDTVVPADEYGPDAPVPACERRDEAGCLVAWITVRRGEFGKATEILNRSRVWNDRGRLVGLAGGAPLCVNPLLGARTDAEADARLNLGAANATGLEWGARPGFMTRQVGAQCVDGILRVTRARSASLRPSGDWIDRMRPHGYNLFWADLEADAKARVAAWEGRPR